MTSPAVVMAQAHLELRRATTRLRAFDATKLSPEQAGEVRRIIEGIDELAGAAYALLRKLARVEPDIARC